MYLSEVMEVGDNLIPGTETIEEMVSQFNTILLTHL